MMVRVLANIALAIGVACMLDAHAGTLDEDEARIDALIKAERAAAAAKAAASADANSQAPAPVAAVVFAPAPAAPASNADWLAPAQERNDGLSFADLAQHIGARVSIMTAGERVHDGTISAADPRQVTLRVKRPGGSATYALPRNQIVRIVLR